MEDKKPINILDDICKITTIPTASMNKLFNKIEWCSCNSVEESRLAGDTLTEVNIGIGNLIISVVDNKIEYKFIPSTKLEKGLVETIIYGKNPLVVHLEETFANRIVKTFKDMF